MSRLAYMNLTKEVKSKLSDIIINFNYLELKLKQTLCKYIDSKKNDFVENVLLHNSITSFNAKLSLLKYIVAKEGITFKDWETFHKIINTRNAVAHSDNLLNFDGDIIGEDIIDDDFDIRIPIYESLLNGPKITIVKDGKINVKELDIMYNEFNDNFRVVEKALDDITSKLTV